MSIQLSQCYFCKHYTEEGKCEAFPDGIPKDLLSGKVSHKEPYPGDNGVVFEETDVK